MGLNRWSDSFLSYLLHLNYLPLDYYLIHSMHFNNHHFNHIITTTLIEIISLGPNSKTQTLFYASKNDCASYCRIKKYHSYQSWHFCKLIYHCKITFLYQTSLHCSCLICKFDIFYTRSVGLNNEHYLFNYYLYLKMILFPYHTIEKHF